MLRSDQPALVLAPMDGITDAAMRELQGRVGAFTYAVSEFLRVSTNPLPAKVFRRDVPELVTPHRLPVQVQLLGGDPDLMAESAMNAVRAGATAVDINFGCPAPVVNRHDGGASLLRSPCRVRAVVSAVRGAVPAGIPVSAKLRLGWDSIDAIDENAAMAAEGGASWLTIHARTKSQGYNPPVYWPAIGRVRQALGLPVVANGDIWSLDDFRRCQDETGCRHYMLGRGALADPSLSHRVARELGLWNGKIHESAWSALFREFVRISGEREDGGRGHSLLRLKQWMKLAHRFGRFEHFDALKQIETLREFFDRLGELEGQRVLATV